MLTQTREALETLLSDRQDAAYHRLLEKREYRELCREQKETQKAVEALYRQLDKDDRLTISRHYEGEDYKTGMLLDETYLQGLQDCFWLIGLLSGRGARF